MNSTKPMRQRLFEQRGKGDVNDEHEDQVS